MITKIKNNLLLRDEVANILLTDASCREFTECIISFATGIPLEVVKDNLTLFPNRVNKNINTKYSYTDVIYENNTSYINLEVNYSRNNKTNNKNLRYVYQLALRQTKRGGSDFDIKPVYQINLNTYDMFNANKFIYRSSLMEESLHLKRDNVISIIDINLDFLGKMEYTEVMEEHCNSLARVLYIFVCNDTNILDKMYGDDDIMEKVRDKIEDLTEDFDELLYYNREEYLNEVKYLDGKEAGKSDEKRNIAKNMLNDNVSLDAIIKYTGLTKEEIESLK